MSKNALQITYKKRRIYYGYITVLFTEILAIVVGIVLRFFIVGITGIIVFQL